MIRTLDGKSPKIHPTAFVSEFAYIVGDVELGPNSSIWPGAVIRADSGKIQIGAGSNVRTIQCYTQMQMQKSEIT